MENYENDATNNDHCIAVKYDSSVSKKNSGDFLFFTICIFFMAMIFGVAALSTRGVKKERLAIDNGGAMANLNGVIAAKGLILPVVWGDIGMKLVKNGAIDLGKFEKLYAGHGGLNAYTVELLKSSNNGRIFMNAENSNIILNLLWAFGLANKNEILEKGPMMDKKYGGADKFASTGSWPLSSGNPMNHYSHHKIIELTPEQQAMVEKVSKNIFRPCCGNSTYFPDCNHGMAMLGLLQLMAAQGVKEDEMYKAALAVNAYWFPDTYANIARYLASRGLRFTDISPRELLGEKYSSGQGYSQILSEIEPQRGRGASCGV